MVVFKTNKIADNLKQFVLIDVETNKDLTSDYLVTIRTENDEIEGFILKLQNNEVYVVNNSEKVKTYLLNKVNKKFECIKTYMPTGIINYIKKVVENAEFNTKYILVQNNFEIVELGYKIINNVKIKKLGKNIINRLEQFETIYCIKQNKNLIDGKLEI